ncbi:MAG TPA: methyltransferase domain-containing protein [Rhizomicrobium sp.]|jgi:trans-aconitate 2-methyltransferase|nr:methyltransferase domain-containing protein [Rhizomicrobium sp.]
MAWNPETYLGFAAERTRPAAELITRIFAQNPSRIADLGCGPGNSTALIAARWPSAHISGIDNSQEMLDEARKSNLRAEWELHDIANWNLPAPYDVIVSNATLQWLPGHEVLLPELLAHVAPGGWFAFQVPRNFDDPSHTLLRALIAEESWREKFTGFENRAGALSPAAYYDILAPHAAALDIWETRYVQVLEGEDAVLRWMSGTGLRPYLAHLNDADAQAFTAEYRARLTEAYPQRHDGKTLFPFLRLFAVARR